MADTRLTRRGLLGGAAAGAAVAALPDAALARRRRRRTRRTEVVVIGAGLAGLTAARDLVRARHDVLVLEARDRVGGRTLNAPIGGGKVVEIGGQWIGPTQDRLSALARSLGIGTFKTYNTGSNIYLRRGVRTPYASDGPLGPIPPDPTGVADVAGALAELDRMAREVPLDAPWKAPKAKEWDSQTLETWKQAHTTTDAGRFLLDVSCQAVFAAEPRDLSLLFVLFYIHSAGNERSPGTLERLTNTPSGAQESRFVGGSQLISIKLARKLGHRVLLDQPVRRISQDRHGVRVECDRLVVEAERAIVAMAPAMTRHIHYHPALPEQRAQLIQRYPNGSVIKCEAVYPEPFWRREGLTGQAVGDADPVRVTFDNSPPDGSPGVMLGFIEGEQARKWGSRPAAERKAAVLRSFAAYFGDRMLSPTRYIEKNWTEDRWTRGCYEGYAPPGVLLDYGPAIRRPVGRVHWAGSETSPIWNGYMEGAVRSGERVAREVRAALRGRSRRSAAA